MPSIRDAKAPRPRSDIAMDEPLPFKQELDGSTVYNVPGGRVELFPGTGAPPEDVQLQNKESYIYTGQGPVPDRLQDIGYTKESFEAGIEDPRLQMYMDDPELVQLHSDLARVKNQDPTTLEGNELKEYQSAQARIDAAAAPTQPTGQLPQIVSMDQVKQFEQIMIQEEFGGVDPRTRNIYDEVYALPESYYMNFYQDNYWQPGAPIWGDLDAKSKNQIKTQARSMEFNRLQQEIQLQVDALNRTIADATNQAKRTEAAMKELEKQRTARQKAAMKAKTEAGESIPNIQKSLVEAQTKLSELEMAGDPSSVAMQREYIQSLVKQLTGARRTAGETTAAGAPDRTGVKEGQQLKAPTKEVLEEAKRLHPNDLQAALKWLQDQGYDTSSKNAIKEKPSQPSTSSSMGEPLA